MMRAAPGKFSTDLLWNAGAFALSALFGVLVNLLIIRWYDAAALGVFNLVYAMYILLSQLAVGGVHLAVQAFVPRELAAGRNPATQVAAAMVLATITSIIVMAVAWVGRDLPGEWFDSIGVGKAFGLAIPGLIFFSWNKVLLSFHNGARRMRLFAVFQFLRFLLLFLGVLFLALGDAPSERLPVTLFWTEALLALILLPISLRYWTIPTRAEFKPALQENFRYGNKAMAGNLLLDVNTRVDVFMLGIYMNDAMVGLYSFAATIAEGVLQLPVIFRNNINPVMSRAWHTGGTPLLNKVVLRNRKAFFRLLAPLVLITIPLFPVAMWVLGMHDDPDLVWSVYAILAFGIALTSGHQPFLMIFGQLGNAGTQTVFIAGFFLSNVLLNLALIPALGIHGAATATALSFVAMVLLMRALALKRYDLRL
ncbi:MAG: polysaccharide biosynthesis C-terminal domain-containing protein [Flavobacteriales bacterium]|nr:polysaccharide biosynthesis C-terminal domain-containing protein [Flavobacteriales bacterium]